MSVSDDGRFPSRPTDARAGTRHVFVRDLVVITLIGVHDAEKRAPQRIVVNVDLV
ncbi:MAG: dihydroneopterin aldolase, partial [Hyphomicrobiaceae bacterium]